MGITASVLAACGGVVEDDVPGVGESLVEEVEALVAGPGCTNAPFCANSQARPQCFAASREASFGFETFQFVEVPSAAPYSFVRLVVKRLSERSDGLFRVELRELPAGSESIEASTLVTTTALHGSIIPRTNTTVTLRFPTPVALAPSTGSTPRYVLVFKVTDGNALSVGIACAEQAGALPGVTAGGRKFRRLPGNDLPAAWKTNPRDLAIAVGHAAGVSGPCAITAGAACDDGNATSGDGCSDTCQPEPGYACSGVPATCTDVDECAANADDCHANATCTNTPGSFTCACNAGSTGDGKLSCTAVTAIDCNALKSLGAPTGFSAIDPDGAGPLASLTTHCDMETSSGGWTLVELRSKTLTSTTSAAGLTALDQYPRALTDAAWVALRDRSTKVMLVSETGTLGAILDIAKLKATNCTTLRPSLTAHLLAHRENSGCDVSGADYCLFGYTAVRRTAIYNLCSATFFDAFPLASNAGATQFPPFVWEPDRLRVYVR